jgi:hypothetical protein
MKRIVVNLVAWMLLIGPLYAQQQGRAKTIATISDITSLIKSVSFGVLPQVDVDKLNDAYLNESYLLIFANFLDYNVIGAGRSIVIEPDRITSFIVEKINERVDQKLISDLLIAELNKGTFNPEGVNQSRGSVASMVAIGGYLVTEFEYHEEDGRFVPLYELNQAKIFINARLVANQQSSINVLAEWNPVPEEVIHHIDEIIVNNDTVSLPEIDEDERVPFERLSVTIENVGGSGINITSGQIRNPFGFWSDYTSHRNFSSTKNNFLVNGFALKKIELGVQIDKEFKGGFGFKTAIVHGRNGRTAPLFRQDVDEKYDWVTRFHYSHNNFTAGFSSYLGEFSVNKRTAFGIDFLASAKNISLSGEFVYQYNDAPQEVFRNLTEAVSPFRSVSGYLQFDLVLTNKLRAYGLYDIWMFNTKNGENSFDSIKIFHGLRYYINKNVRWTLFEFGHINTLAFNGADTHMSTQLEITF